MHESTQDKSRPSLLVQLFAGAGAYVGGLAIAAALAGSLG